MNDWQMGAASDAAMSEPVPHAGQAAAANENPVPTLEETAAIKEWFAKYDEDVAFHANSFKMMDEDEEWAEGRQWPGQTDDDDRYVADLTQRVVRHRVSALYAKNPQIVARRKPRMDFEFWDEDFSTLQQAMQNPQDPINARLLADVSTGAQRRQLIQKIGRTLELVMAEQISLQQPMFKREMKRMLRRQEITAVGYIKLDFIRESDLRPDIEAQIGDLTNRLSEIKRLKEESAEGEFCDYDADAEKLRVAIETLQTQRYVVKREGLVFRFPRTQNIIPSKECVQLEGFVGAPHVGERFWLTAETIERIYGIDVTNSSGPSGTSGPNASFSLTNSNKNKKKLGTPKDSHEVVLMYDINTGSRFTICRGYDGYLERPAPPVIVSPQFYPWYTVCFNETESQRTIYPRSTVRLIRHPQKEINRSQEALRQHRIAMKPLYAAATGALDKDDKENLANHQAHDVIELSNMQEGQSTDQKFGMVKKHNIDPNVYSTSEAENHINKIIGITVPNMGGQSDGVTATENSIAQDSQQADTGSNADDQDDVLSLVMRDAGHNAMMLFSPETVKQIAGPGAVWPSLHDDDIMRDIYLDIEAGSSGRPHTAATAATLQRLMPFIAQTPGFRPDWIARKLGTLIDDNVDFTEMYLEGLPSMNALNRGPMGMGGQPPAPGTGPGDPTQQGPAGADNAPVGPQAAPPALPMLPGVGGVTAAPQQAGGMMTRMRGMLRGR